MAEEHEIQSRHSELLNDGVGRCDIPHLRRCRSIPDTIAITNCSLKDHDVNRDIHSSEAPFFASYFASGLTLPLHPFTRAVLSYTGITPSQGNGNFYKIINCFIMLGNLTKQHLNSADLFYTFMLKHEPRYHGLFFQRRTNALEMLSKLPTKDDTWNKYPLLVSGNWEFGFEVVPSSGPRVAKTKAVDLPGVCKRVNDFVALTGEPYCYEDRVKKIMNEDILKRNFETLLETYCTHPVLKAVRTMPEEDHAHIPIEVDVNLSGVVVEQLRTKRKLRYSGTRSTSKLLNQPSEKKIALLNPIVKMINEIDDVFHNESNCYRFRNTIVSTIATSSQECIPSDLSENTGIASLALDLALTRPPVEHYEELTDQASYESERRTKTKALLSQHGVGPVQHRSIEDKKAKAPSWVPSFGKHGNKVFSSKSSLYHDENDALDFVMGMATPRDHRFLSLKDELTKHYLAQHHIVKASLLYCSNNKFMESASKQITEMNLLLNRLSKENNSLTAQNKELQDWKATDDIMRSNLEKQFQAMKRNYKTSKLELAMIQENSINLEKTVASDYNKIETLSAQLTRLESKKNEAENERAQALNEKMEALCAELQPKLVITQSKNSELLADNDDLQTKLDGAAAFYQALVDKKVKEYFVRGLTQGHQDCLNLYGFVEAIFEDEENDPQNAGLTITANNEGASVTTADTQCIRDGSYTGELINKANIIIEHIGDGISSSEIVKQIEQQSATSITDLELTVVSETLEENQSSESLEVLTEPLAIIPLAMCFAEETSPRPRRCKKNI